MDADRFDGLLRSFVGAPSRRRVARGLAALLVGAAPAVLRGVDGARDAAAKPKKKKPKPRTCEPVTESFCASPKPSGDCCDVLGETCTDCGCCPNASPKCCARGTTRICCPANFACCGVGKSTECCDPETEQCTACGCCPNDLAKCCKDGGACVPNEAECCGQNAHCYPADGEKCCAYGDRGKKRRQCCNAEERCDPRKGCVKTRCIAFQEAYCQHPKPNGDCCRRGPGGEVCTEAGCCPEGQAGCPSDDERCCDTAAGETCTLADGCCGGAGTNTAPCDETWCCNTLAGQECARLDGCCDTLNGGKKVCDGKWCCDENERCVPGVGCRPSRCASGAIECPWLDGVNYSCCRPEARCCNGTCCMTERPSKCCPGRTACYDPNAPCPG